MKLQNQNHSASDSGAVGSSGPTNQIFERYLKGNSLLGCCSPEFPDCPFYPNTTLFTMGAAKIYYDADADITVLDGQTIVFFGFGNQGAAQAQVS